MLASVLLSGCGAHVYHKVEPGETLYSISWIYGYDFKDIAAWNGIRAPYAVTSGQRLRVAPDVEGPPGVAVTAPVNTARPHTSVTDKTATAIEDTETEKTIIWSWPASGKIVNRFTNEQSMKKGLDIGGKLGQPVYSAAAGRVAYRGHGIVGYGELIIIKHSQSYLSAYAHNHEILVKEGENVKPGQMIARMGDSGTTFPHLHFQIRRDGKPVDPMKYLPKL